MVGGVDVSYVGDLGVGAVVVLDYETLELLETAVAVCPVKMPYVPTLLSFRELPPAIAAIKRLKLQPDVFLVDAQGWAHPYRCGFASHLGVSYWETDDWGCEEQVNRRSHRAGWQDCFDG